MKQLAAVLFGATLSLLSLFVVARPAFAAGSVKAENGGVIKEEDGKWKLKLTIDYGGTPEIQFIPMDFTFEQVVLYERSLTDEGGDKPILNKNQLQNQTPQIEGMDVGFSDGTGKILRTTNFTVVLKRDHGFEAGEYMLTLKKGDGGQQIGQKIRITLNGDNPVINRKSMNFGADKGRDDPAKVKSKSLDASQNASKDEGDKSGDGSSSGSGSGDTGTAGDQPGAVKPKQGGCGCELVGEPRRGVAGWLVFGLFAAVLARAGRKNRAR